MRQAAIFSMLAFVTALLSGCGASDGEDTVPGGELDEAVSSETGEAGQGLVGLSFNESMKGIVRVGILSTSSFSTHCTGVLVTNSTVLTSGMCELRVSGTSGAVMMGSQLAVITAKRAEGHMALLRINPPMVMPNASGIGSSTGYFLNVSYGSNSSLANQTRVALSFAEGNGTGRMAPKTLVPRVGPGWQDFNVDGMGAPDPNALAMFKLDDGAPLFDVTVSPPRLDAVFTCPFAFPYPVPCGVVGAERFVTFTALAPFGW